MCEILANAMLWLADVCCVAAMTNLVNWLVLYNFPMPTLLFYSILKLSPFLKPCCRVFSCLCISSPLKKKSKKEIVGEKRRHKHTESSLSGCWAGPTNRWLTTHDLTVLTLVINTRPDQPSIKSLPDHWDSKWQRDQWGSEEEEDKDKPD